MKLLSVMALILAWDRIPILSAQDQAIVDPCLRCGLVADPCSRCGLVVDPCSRCGLVADPCSRCGLVVIKDKKTAKLDQAALKGTIVFVSDRDGTLHIWTMHASGKNLKQLTKGKDADADPRFSPDGKKILYTTLRDGFPQIWLMNRDGSQQKFLTNGSQANWAPDGKSIIFIEDNQAFIRDLETGKERLVTPKKWDRCGVPAFSPDGKRFAVASRHTGTIGIYILSVDGKQIEPLQAEEACCTPQWSKDGKKILCQSVKGHIHEAGVTVKGWDQLTFGADVQHDARYSPDGTMILFCRAPAAEGPWQICVRRLGGDDDDFLTITREGSNLLPDWSEAE